MPDVKVTREHREAVLKALDCEMRWNSPEHYRDECEEWLTYGGQYNPYCGAVKDDDCDAEKLAELLAATERRTRSHAAQLLRGLYSSQFETDEGPCVVHAIDVWKLIKQLESAQ